MNALLVDHWPTLTIVVAATYAVYYIVKHAVLAFDSVAEAFGAFGKYVRARRAITSSEADFLRKQVVDLDKRVRALLYRDSCYFAYVLKDQEWHQHFELLASAHGWKEIPRHQGFLEFRDRWMRERGLEKEFEFWT